jgi:hypothetical protein
MLTISMSVIEIVALVPLTDVVAAIGVLSDAFLTCTAVTPADTVYVMLAVVPEYVTPLPDSVGAANCFSNVCVADAALSRPAALPSATTTTFNGEFASVNGTVIVAVNEVMELVAPETGVLSDAFLTCTAVTPVATVYVMLAVVPEYVTIPEFDIMGAANATPNGLVCAVSCEPVLKSLGGLEDTFDTFHPLMFWLNALAF